MPKYAALIYTPAETEGTGTPEDRAQIMAEYNEFGEKAGAAGVVVGGEALQDTTTATTVRAKGKGGDIVTSDGPFAETKDVLGGFYVLDCADLDEAVAWAAQIPGAWHGQIEVRPLIDFGGELRRSVETTIREEGGQVLATLIRLTGDFTLAEDALQEAAVAALDHWQRVGVPKKPAAWLTKVARNKALDHIRREAKRTDKEREAVQLLSSPDEGIEPTDPLRLLFTCCHPALSADAQVALTLRTISQLTTREIALGLLQPEATVGQRISRAKHKIKAANIPYRVPSDAELPNRLPPVLHVLYVTFTAGYAAFEGPAAGRVELGEEAIRITRMLVRLMPDEPEARGILALMLATWARRATRVDEHGDIVLLVDQGRSLWETEAIDEARSLLAEGGGAGGGGWYRIQASIALEHASAPSFADTNWHAIADRYAELAEVNPSAVVTVNRAVAVAHASGAADGVALLDDVRDLPEMQAWHLYWSTRAELLTRLGSTEDAMACLERALACVMNDGDRRLLERRYEEGSAAVQSRTE